LEPCFWTILQPSSRDLLSVPEIIWAKNANGFVACRNNSSVPSAASPKITQKVLITIRNSKEIDEQAAKTELGILERFGLPKALSSSEGKYGK
jgi:hypothetical protein